MTTPLRSIWAALMAAALVWTACPAHADEIEILDLDTCETKTIRVAEIVSETWATVTYRRTRAGRGPVEQVPTLAVVEVRRDGDDAIQAVAKAIRQRNYEEAVTLGRQASGGGWRINNETGERSFNSYNTGDPTGRGKGPSWKSEYAHFFYAKALFLRAKASKDRDGLNEALLALADLPVPDGASGQTSGGFLGRFEGGNSRFYGEAMALHAQTLVALGKYDDAARAYSALATEAARVPLAPAMVYEASLGPGRIAEAKGDLKEASKAYGTASSGLMAALDAETKRCLQLDLGRFFARARAESVRIELDEAEKSGNSGQFAKLKAQLEQETPEALARRYQRKKPSTREAILVGATDPEVRAVAAIALGLANLKSGKLDEAVASLREVTVQHFRRRDQVARAYFYLAQAAEAAAKKAKPEAKPLYEALVKESKEALKSTYSDTEWARR